MRLLRRTSFTARLLATAAVVLALLVLIDYVALLQLPSRVARDTVELALRDHVQSLNAEFREDQLALQDEVSRFVDRRDVQLAIFDRDAERLERLIADTPSMAGDVRFRFISRAQIRGSGIGVITAYSVIRRRGEPPAPVVFYRPMTNDLLNRAVNAGGEVVSFAIERENEFVARSDRFPDELDPRELDVPIDSTTAHLDTVRVDDEPVHLYSRTLTSGVEYQLHALASPELEDSVLADSRADVRTAIGGMTLATIAAFIFLVFFANRTVRGFADRVRRLADGDFSSRMPVRGNDAFAELAGSVNRLSVQLQEQLGQLEQTAGAFRRTLETLEEGICVWNSDGEIEFWNRGAEQLTGLARERANAADPVVAFLQAERSPGTRRVTLPVRRSGAGLVVDLVVTAMPDGGILQTFRDTTLVDMLQQTQRNFMATAAHELRTPITTILGFADTLTNTELKLSDGQRAEFLEIIREQSYHLQELAEAFFTSYQLANERVEVSIRTTRLDDVISEAIDRVAASNEERAEEVAAITVDLPDDCAALADRRALVGVVSALVDNAVKYGSPPISVSAQLTGGIVSLRVSDEGQGIDLYHQARVFDPFFRIDVDMRQGVGGAGLGLYTARKLVEAMHGVIRVRSTVGSGTSFIVELPAAPVESGGDDGDQEGRPLRLVG